MFDMLKKLLLVPEKHVTIMTLKSFFSLSLLTLFLIMSDRSRFWISGKVIIAVVLKNSSTIDKNIQRQVIFSPVVLVHSADNVHAVKLVRNRRS